MFTNHKSNNISKTIDFKGMQNTNILNIRPLLSIIKLPVPFVTMQVAGFFWSLVFSLGDIDSGYFGQRCFCSIFPRQSTLVDNSHIVSTGSRKMITWGVVDPSRSPLLPAFSPMQCLYSLAQPVINIMAVF